MPPFPVDPEKDTICDIIRCWIARQPDAPLFLEEGAAALTFGGLGAVMDHFRDTLWASGMGRGDRIAIVLPSGPDLASALLGVMGVCVPLPLNPVQTLDEFSRLFRENDIKALIVEEGLATPALEAARGEGLPILPVRRTPGGAAGAMESRPMSGASSVLPSAVQEKPGPDDLYLLVSTSGTTGQSRVTLRTNRPRVKEQLVAEKTYQFTLDDRCLLARPLYYGGGLGDLFRSVLSGGSVAFLPNFETEAFFRILQDLGPTWYSAGPTVQRAVHTYLLEHSEAAKGSSLRFVRATSAALEPNIAEDLERFLSTPVIEHYSCNGVISCNPLPPGRRKRGTVGLPINCEVRIRSLEADFLTVDERGEVVIKGGRA